MRIAVIQMVSGIDVQANIRAAARLIAQAAEVGAKLVVLPEYFCLMGTRDHDKLAIQELFSSTSDSNPGAGALQAFLSGQARTHQIHLVGGTIPLTNLNANTHQQDKVRNSCLVYAPNGALQARYDKIHLFSFQQDGESYNEGKTLEAGEEVMTFELTDKDCILWKLGLSVCYDLRFPELYRAMGADILLVPAAFTATTGSAHWEVLLRARAIENQAYVLASAQGGLHENGRRTWGHSMVIDPWGKVLNCLEEGEGVLIADLNKEDLNEYRGRLPALRHRKQTTFDPKTSSTRQ